MRTTVYFAIVVSFFLSSCNREPSLQKYFVENADKKGFVALDVSPKIFNMDQTALTSEQKTALESCDKKYVFGFKL